MMRSPAIAAVLALLLSGAVSQPVVCNPADCDCGECLWQTDPSNPEEKCQQGQNFGADPPASKDTGGSCRWLGCTARGSHVFCSSDHKCLCPDGYFANSEYRSKCVPNEVAPCWRHGDMCQVAAAACYDCNLVADESYYRGEVRGWKAAVDQVSLDFPKVDKDDDPAFYACGKCLTEKSMLETFIACTSCTQRCWATMSMSLASAPAKENFLVKATIVPVATMAMFLVIAGLFGVRRVCAANLQGESTEPLLA